jgi:hypothetical protein
LKECDILGFDGIPVIFTDEVFDGADIPMPAHVEGAKANDKEPGEISNADHHCWL